MLPERGRRKVTIGALAVEPDRRADQGHAGDGPNHLPVLGLNVARAPG